MLKSVCKAAAAFAVAMSFSAAANAAEHVVMIVDGSYFPNVVYASDGDELTFINESSNAHTVAGEDGAWTSESLGLKETFSFEIDENTPSTFSSASDDSGDYTGQIIFQ